MSQGIHLRKFGEEATIDFDVYEVDGVDLRIDWVPAVADCEIMKDGGTSTQCTNTAVDEGSTYSIVLTATEMQAARLVLKVVDAATKVFLDKVVIIETYGNASAQHAMDFDEADGSQFTEAGGTGDQLTALATAAGLDTLTDALVMVDTTITISSQTSFTLAAGSADDDAYNGCICVIEDASTSAQRAIGLIDDYTGGSKTVTLQADPGIFTMTTGDKIKILSLNALEIVKATWDRVISKANHNIAQSSGKTLRQAAALIVNEGTLQSATADTAVIAASASGIDDIFSNNLLVITDGLGAGQSRVIPDYTGSTKTCTITPAWVITPDATSDYEILPASVHTATQNGEYDDATVYVDTINGRAGVLIGVNGTTTDPSDNIADARTIADILNLKKFFLSPDSVVTLAQSFDGYAFLGAGGTVNLGGQSISGSFFSFVNVSGIGTGSNDTLFNRVRFSGPTQLENPTFFDCDLFSNITFTGANVIGIHNCFNSSGTTTILDFGAAVGNIQLNMVVNGDFEIQNMGQTGTDTLDYNGIGILVFNVNNIGGTATIIGNPEITDSSAGLTVNNITASLKLDEIQGVGFVTATDSLEAIRVNGVSANLTEIEGQSTIDGESIIGTYRILGAVLAGKSSGGGAIFRSMDDAKVRLTSTVDGSSNRTAVTRDGT